MGQNTKIEWAHHTFNPWMGCQKVGPGCDNCYAEGWARSLRDQCAAAGVPFLFKQWGEWGPNWHNDDSGEKINGSEWIDRMGKKIAGRLLDGVEHNGYPEPR